MKITANGKTFEYLLDGKPITDADFLEAFAALGSAYFPFAVVTQSKDGPEAAVRAVTFAADAEYAEQLVDCMEGKLKPGEEIGGVLLGENEEDEEEEDEDFDG
mgnify:CR=1 FL=1